MSVIGTMQLSWRRTLALVGAVTVTGSAALARSAEAQSAQPYSLQLAALFAGFNNGGASVGGVGVEPQFRLNRLYSTDNFGALSLGIGGQYTSHSRGGDNLKISGLFAEPRWVPALKSNSIFPYLSARLAFLRQSNNFETPTSSGTGFGAGGGVAIKLTKTINLDAGVQLVRQKLGNFEGFTTYTEKEGASAGFPR
jgi:opacity protein-like surface antigen